MRGQRLHGQRVRVPFRAKAEVRGEVYKVAESNGVFIARFIHHIIPRLRPQWVNVGGLQQQGTCLGVISVPLIQTPLSDKTPIVFRIELQRMGGLALRTVWLAGSEKSAG